MVVNVLVSKSVDGLWDLRVGTGEVAPGEALCIAVSFTGTGRPIPVKLEWN